MKNFHLTWLGCAGFSLRMEGYQILVDPYVSRNPRARPRQVFTPDTLVDHLGAFSHIFISHGHFDHLMDIPPLLSQCPKARVFCSHRVQKTLIRNGVDSEQIQTMTPNSPIVEAGPITARAHGGRHIRFDLGLLVSTLVRTGRQLGNCLPLFYRYPCGPVLNWQFTLGDKNILFAGSAGASENQLRALKKEDIHMFMVPLQGHSKICDIAARQVEILEPEQVIPHHMDDFYPPISQFVDISPFRLRVEKNCPRTRITVPHMNIPFQPWP